MHFPLSNRTVLGTDSRTIDAVSIKDGALFAVLSTDAVTLWHAATLTPLHCTRRVTASLESTGFNRRLFLRSDEQMIVVQTAGNVLLIYDICEDGNSEARSYKTLDHAGVPRLWLKHRQNIRVEAGVLALCATADRLIISTKRPAMVQTLFWDKHDGDMQIVSKALRALNFLKRTGTSSRIVEIVYHSALDCFLWLASDGIVYLVENKEDQWEGQAMHEPETTAHEAVLISVNNVMATITISLANSELRTWALVRAANSQLTTRLVFSHRCDEAIGSIRSLTYTPDGTTLMVCGETGWTLISASGCSIASTVLPAEKPVRSDSSDVSMEQTVVSMLRCSIWICDGFAALLFPLQEDCFVVNSFCKQSGMNLMCPRFLYLIQDSLHTSSDSEYRSLWQPILPSAEVEHLAPYKSHVSSPCERFLAIAGRSGLAHYSRASGLWKTHRNLEEALETVLVADPVWYHHYLIVATQLDDDRYEIRILSREFDVDEILSSIEFDSKPLRLAVQNGHLYSIQLDQTIQRCEIMRNKDGQIVMKASIAFSMAFPGVDGALYRSLAILDEPSDVRHAHLVLLQGDVLSLIYFPDTTQEDLTCVTITRQIEWAQVSDGTGRLRNAIFASTGQSIKVWFNLLHYTSMNDEFPACSLVIPVDFIPLHVSIDTGLIEGVVVKNDSQTELPSSGIQSLTYEAKSFIPDVLLALIRQGLSGEAFVISTRYSSSPHFNYYLELILFRALEEAHDDSHKLLTSTWTLLEKHYDLLPEVVVACARKSEVTTWNTLFRVTGPPLSFYQASLSRGDLKTAGAYLVILLTMDTSLEHKDYTVDLISRSVDQGNWDLAIELTRFYSSVTSDKQEAFSSINALMHESSNNHLKVVT